MNADFKKRAVEILISAVISAAMVIAAGYGYAVNVLEPLVAEGQVTARGGGVTRFNSEVQMQSGAEIDNGLVINSGGETITAGGLTVTAGGLTLTDGGLDMTNDPITNIGNAGTDFGTNGSLTTANTLTVTTGGLVVSAGTLAANAGIAVDTSAFTVADTTGNTVVSGTLTVTNTTALVGVTTFTASPIMASESITPTDGGVITITANLITLTPAGAVGNSLAACTTGKWAVLYNSVNANVVITDTGNFVGSGDATLGQYDAMQLVCIGTKWVQASSVITN